jgi:hypothetical protein
MPIMYQTRVYRADLKANPNVLYIFGDNIIRKGLGGQAKEMRGEPNAVGVRVKVCPDITPQSYLTDNTYAHNMEMISNDLKKVFEHLGAGGVVVIPADGIGTGLAKMEETCPQTFAYLKNLLDDMRLF